MKTLRSFAPLITAALLIAVAALAFGSDTTSNQFDVKSQAYNAHRLKDNGDSTYSFQTWLTGDGTNVAKLGSAANLAGTSGASSLLTTHPGQWVATHAPAVNTAASASKSAGAAGVRHVCTSVSGTVAADSTAPSAVIVTLNLRDGATGAGSVLASWTFGIEATASKTTPFSFSGLNIPGTAATAMTLEFAAAGGAHTFESVTLTGYDSQ